MILSTKRPVLSNLLLTTSFAQVFRIAASLLGVSHVTALTTTSSLILSETLLLGLNLQTDLFALTKNKLAELFDFVTDTNCNTGNPSLPNP